MGFSWEREALQIQGTENPQMFLLSTECEASKEENSVGLVCLVIATEPLEIAWNQSSNYQTQRAFHYKKNNGNYISWLSLRTSELNSDHTCLIKNSKQKLEKTWSKKQNTQSSQKSPPPPQTTEHITEATKAMSTKRNIVGAIAPSNLSVNFLATPTHPEMSSWLICEVSGFFPQDIHLIWLKFQSKMNTSYFATAYPTQQPGGNTFQTWSVLRIPVPLRASLNTYTCVVEHEASQTKLNASKSLDISGMVNTIPNLCVREEQSNNYMDLDEETSLWPTLCTFVALFLLTLLYSGFVTFIKVK